jgi:hypothetical protein
MKSPETEAMCSGYPRGVQPPNIADVMRPEAGIVRWARSSSAALVCTVIAAAAHLAAGGRASSMSLAAVFLGTWAICAALARRRLTSSQLVGLLMFGQAVTHVVSAPAGGAGSDATMLTAHIVGTALCAMLLRRGEDALWTLAERVALRALRVVASVALGRWPRLPGPVPVRRTRRLVLLTHMIDGRGPPSGLA